MMGTITTPRLVIKAPSPKWLPWWSPRIQNPMDTANRTPMPSTCLKAVALMTRNERQPIRASSTPARKKRTPINNRGGISASASLEKIQPAAAARVTPSRTRSARRECSVDNIKYQTHKMVGPSGSLRIRLLGVGQTGMKLMLNSAHLTPRHNASLGGEPDSGQRSEPPTRRCYPSAHLPAQNGLCPVV